MCDTLQCNPSGGMVHRRAMKEIERCGAAETISQMALKRTNNNNTGIRKRGVGPSPLCSTLHTSLELETFNCSDKSLFHCFILSLPNLLLSPSSPPPPRPGWRVGAENRRHVSYDHLPWTRRAIPVLLTTKPVLEHCGGVMEATGIGRSDKE